MKDNFLINQNNFMYNFAYKDEISNINQTEKTKSFFSNPSLFHSELPIQINMKLFKGHRGEMKGLQPHGW